MTASIVAEGLSKAYRVYVRKSKRSFFPRREGAGTNWPLASRRRELIWALRDATFSIEQGEIVGVVGKNGAGKTTLLKLLSRITEPSSGTATLVGRLASLLEVGTGFHPELTGRENIFLNAAILGMKRTEIRQNLDAIVDFAEVSRFIDTPVKRYSSGMYVRLAFAVAAHLDPDILMVDEVLAVGDHEFQQKCLGRMRSLSGDGRTVLFVSHNLAAVEHLCPRSLLLVGGSIAADGPSQSVIKQYLEGGQTHAWESREGCYSVDRTKFVPSDLGIAIQDVWLSGREGAAFEQVRIGDPLSIHLRYRATQNFVAPAFVIRVKSALGVEVLRLSTMPISGFVIDTLYEEGVVCLKLPSLPLTGGRYYIDVGFVRAGVEWVLDLEEVLSFDVEPTDVYGSGLALDQTRGLITLAHRWTHEPARSA